MLEALSRHRRRLIPAVCLMASILLMTFEAKREHPFGPGSLADALAGPARALRGTVRLVARLGPYMASKKALSARAGELAERNRLLESRVVALEAALADQGLKDFVRFLGELPEDVSWAELIGRDPVDRYRSAVLGSGLAHGVVKGMIAVAPEGLVGRVIVVYPRCSVLLFITDEGFSAAVRGVDGGAEGLLRGTGGNACRLTFVDPRADLKEGEILVTSGLDGIFTKGLRVGKVVSIRPAQGGLFLDADVLPLVDLSRLERVALRPPQPEVTP